MDILKISKDIRLLPFVRLIGYPIGAARRNKLKKKYYESSNPDALRKLKGIHDGERCFIIGNGPSLTPADLDLLEGEITMACNKIYALFDKTTWRPTYYVSEDVCVINKEIKKIEELRCLKKFINMLGETPKKLTDCIFFIEKSYVINLYNYKKSFIPKDISYGFNYGGTVTFIMIQLALYMGFSEIYFLGQDFSMPYYCGKLGFIHKTNETRSHFEGGSTFKGSRKNSLTYYTNLYAFEHAKAYCDEHNITIKNATRGGKLEVFERVDFDELMKTIGKQI